MTRMDGPEASMTPQHGTATGAAVRVSGLAKRFPNGEQILDVLTDVNLEIAAGTRNAIVGESGSGKSTLLSLIGGLDAPDSGEIRVGNQLITELDDAELTRYRSRGVGLVFQFHYLLQDFTSLENVMLPAMIDGDGGGRADDRSAARAALRERAEALLALVGLAERREHLPPQLSGGERQRVALARALINDPPLVLADEPTGNLDDRNSRMVEELLFRLVSEQQRTLILVTHNRELATRCGRILELEAGCLTAV